MGSANDEQEALLQTPQWPFCLSEVDRGVLSQKDGDFKKHDWQGLKTVIETNNLASLRRTPSELRRYLKWTKDVMTEYGSVTQYILVHRLPKSWGQPPFTPASPLPFEDAADYRTLPNDWPYALEPGITHLVVWSRTPIPTDPETGDMTAESRARVAMFVNRYFVDALGSGGADKVVWFKNWVSLQSVPSLEHVHVLVRDVGDDMLELWTGERLRRKD